MMVSGKREKGAENKVIELTADDRVADRRRLLLQLVDCVVNEPLEPPALGRIPIEARCKLQGSGIDSGDVSKKPLEILQIGGQNQQRGLLRSKDVYPSSRLHNGR
jgi:hypothetical protein